MKPLLAVAGLSVRMLAEAAGEAGFPCAALDVFGDADTRRAAASWQPIGRAQGLAIDPRAFLAALERLAAAGAAGWIAGSGFEPQPELLAAGNRRLPLIGNPPEAVARVRGPADFFGRLAALGIPHPETRLTPPPHAAGWLCKDTASSGGWGVRPAEATLAGPGIHYQRRLPGVPHSALFLADGRRARLLGAQRQLARPLAGRSYVFRGCLGPLPVAPALARTLAGIADALAGEFGLRGLNGLDFLLADGQVAVLEVNPRPPGCLDLYRGRFPGGLLAAHWAACREGRLPAGEVAAQAIRGFEVVFARRAGRLDGATARSLAAHSWCHDLPGPGAILARGAPACTVSAAAATAREAAGRLAGRRRQVLSLLEEKNAARKSALPVPPLERQ